MTPILNLDKVKEANTKLLKVVEALNEFRQLSDLLSPQERLLTGSVIFNLRSNWEDVGSIGAMGDKHMVSFLLDSLINFLTKPESYIRQQEPKIEVPESGSGGSGPSFPAN